MNRCRRCGDAVERPRRKYCSEDCAVAADRERRIRRPRGERPAFELLGFHAAVRRETELRKAIPPDDYTLAQSIRDSASRWGAAAQWVGAFEFVMMELQLGRFVYARDGSFTGDRVGTFLFSSARDGSFTGDRVGTFLFSSTAMPYASADRWWIGDDGHPHPLPVIEDIDDHGSGWHRIDGYGLPVDGASFVE